MGDFLLVHTQLFSRRQKGTGGKQICASSPDVNATKVAKTPTKHTRTTFILISFRNTEDRRDRPCLYTVLREDNGFFEITL